MLDWGTCPREAGPLGSLLSSPGEQERNAVRANRGVVNMLQFCSVPNSLSHTTLRIKWEVYFSKELCRSSLLCRRYDSACMHLHMCMYSWSWLYNIWSRGKFHWWCLCCYLTTLQNFTFSSISLFIFGKKKKHRFPLKLPSSLNQDDRYGSFLIFILYSLYHPIYPTPPLGQDMTQGQFLSGV